MKVVVNMFTNERRKKNVFGVAVTIWHELLGRPFGFRLKYDVEPKKNMMRAPTTEEYNNDIESSYNIINCDDQRNKEKQNWNVFHESRQCMTENDTVSI